MKVKELIEVLSKLDQERLVVTYDESSLMNIDLTQDWITEQTLFKKNGDYWDTVEESEREELAEGIIEEVKVVLL